MNQKEIGKKIKSIRESQGISREQLAEKLNLSSYSIRNYEQGQRGVNLKNLNKFADALGVPVSEILGIKINELLEVNISNNTGAEKNISEMTINELYDLIYELRNKISSLEDLNATLIENMEKIKKLVNIKY